MKLSGSKLWIVAVSVLILIVVVLMGINTLRRTSEITLPPELSTGEEGDAEGSGALETIRVTPETVQKAVATLERTQQYVRTIAVERFWSGGSAMEETVVYADGAYLRLDTTDSAGEVRHLLTDGETTYIWYGASSNYYAGPSGSVSSDEEQSIPTYESVLELPVIAAADYRVLGEEACIYVETPENELGIVERYWVSLDSGLLVAAEKLQQGETIYRMAALAVLETLPTTEHFTLPDGTVVHTVA